jgi:hypothetical protein
MYVVIETDVELMAIALQFVLLLMNSVSSIQGYYEVVQPIAACSREICSEMNTFLIQNILN